MRALLHNLPVIHARNLGRLLESGALAAGAVIVRWMTESGPPVDPNDESTYDAGPVAQSATVQGLIHFVSATTVQRGHLGFEAGDAIVTFHPTDSEQFYSGGTLKKGLHFELPNGKTYVQAQAGKEIVEFWDVLLAGRKATVTLLLRVKS